MNLVHRMSVVRPEPRPWPLKWIALVILLVLVPYTILTLRYRKPGRAFEPYQDLKTRANVIRLLSAGYQRVALEAEVPADPVRAAASAPVSAAAGGLPPALRDTLVERPLLPAEILSVTAAPGGNALFAYPIAFTCTMPDSRHQLGGAELYVRGDEIVVTPDFEPLSGGLLARSREKTILLTVPPGTLKPGTFHVILVGQRVSKTWTLQVH
jgi:hypothetical protein